MLVIFIPSLLAGLSGCQCAPPVWEGATLSLPNAEHAYAVPVRAASMARDLTEKQLDKLIAKHCPFEPEQPVEELEEEEAPEQVIVPEPVSVDNALVAEELAKGGLVEAVPALEEFSKPLSLGQEYAEGLDYGLPAELVTPAILTITLEEIRWLGKPALELKNGQLYPASKDSHLIPALYEAVDASVDYTIEVAQACGKVWDGSVLLAIDAQVPLSTVYPVMYTLGQARFSTFLFMVNDPDPVETRSQEPAGGLTGSGTLAVHTQEYEWQRFEDTGFDAQDKHSVETQTWATDAPWPSVLDPALPPKAVIDFELNQLFNTLVAAYDRLAEHKVFCAVAAFPDGQTSHPVIPLTHLPPPTPLRIDPRGTVAVHINQIPMIGGPYGDGYHDDLLIMRGDGSRCSLYEMRFETRGDLPIEPTQSLSDFLNTLGEPNLLSEVFEAPADAGGLRAAIPEGSTVTAHLKTVEIPETESRPPQTTVSVGWTEPGKSTEYKELAVVNEPCSSPGYKTPEIDELLCWWAGVGTTFTLQQVGDSLVVKSSRVFEEDIGDQSDEPPSEEITRIPLPPGATVRARP